MFAGPFAQPVLVCSPGRSPRTEGQAVRPRVLVAIAAAVLVVLGADAGARWWLQSVLTHRVATALEARGLTHVRVAVGGWPVLAGLATGRLDRVEVSAVAPFAVLDERLAAVGGVGAAAGAGVAGGAGQVGPVQWSAESGMLVARTELDRGGAAVPVAVAFDVSGDGGDLVVTPQTVAVAGIQLPAQRVSELLPSAAGLLGTRRVALDGLVGHAGLAGLPADARLVSVRVADEGIALVVRADGVTRGDVGLSPAGARTAAAAAPRAVPSGPAVAAPTSSAAPGSSSAASSVLSPAAGRSG